MININRHFFALKGWKHFLTLLISPVAFGLYITLVFLFLCLRFYIAQDSRTTDHANALVNLLSIAHQKSVDFRLQARGPRQGTDQVALLAIDERAVNTIGRWPWPREIIAEAINKAIDHGAKIIAFDMTFSEPTAKVADEILASVQQTYPLPEDLLLLFNEQISKKDSDNILSETFAQQADHTVLGVFYESTWAADSKTSYLDNCLHFVFSLSPAYQIWEQSETIISPFDPISPTVPRFLSQVYRDHLSFISDSIKSRYATPQNFREVANLRELLNHELLAYCNRWLDPNEDELFEALTEAWPDILEEEGTERLPFPNFEAWVSYFKNQSIPHTIPNSINWVMNTPLISQGAHNMGYFNADLDPDGTIRRKTMVARTGNYYMPSLALKTYLVAKNYHVDIQFFQNSKTGNKAVQNFYITDNENGETVFELPTDDQGRLIINYAGPQKMFPYVSMADLLNDDETIRVEQRLFNQGRWNIKEYQVNKSDFFHDKILVVGATAMGIYDLRVTPFDENYPGAETHLNIIDNLLRQDFLKTSSQEEPYMLAGLLVLGLFLSLSLSYLGAISGLVLATASIISVGLFDRFYLFNNGIIIAIILPLILTLSLYMSLTFYKYFTEERGKKELRNTFQKYVSPAIVDEVLKDPSNLELGGKKVRLTVFFSDVRGFTTISEKLDPRALTDLLNSYLTPMTDLVFQHRGTLDKYMGDAIMAFFGAPITYPDHAKWACRCALKHLEKLKELQEEYARMGLPQIDVGIGMNTGEVNVGNMGSETVRNYTVMGDAVNLASRLEGINKQYGTRIIISEFTYEDIKDSFVCREIDLVRVKGKAQPVRIYELIAEQQASPQMQEVLTFFQQGYHFYHQKEWQKANDCFLQALHVRPDDEVSKLYIDRCKNYLTNPPPLDWDGVFVMTSK